MKQVLQNLRNGETSVQEVPAPGVGRGGVLIATRATVISAGTERMLVEFGQASWLGKLRSQPDKVKQVLDKIRTEGLLPTLEAVFSKLDEPLPLGYCNAGVVVAVGSDVSEFQPGDRVVSNGPHAEMVSVPQRLCARIPAGVSDEEAAFTVLSSIGLQGIRLAQPTLGETVVVYGLGIIGLVTVQLLKAQGCQVIGIDINPQRLELAASFGAQTIDSAKVSDPAGAVRALTGGRGADAVLIAASAKTDDIAHQAAEMSRKRGRIVLIGVVGLNLRRADFYEKELTFQVSCSYGPGRYDDNYEQRGQDYPVGFVRWTEQRNFEAILDQIRQGRLNLRPLITHRVPLEEAERAYRAIQSDPQALGVVLSYPPTEQHATTISIPEAGQARTARSAAAGSVTVSLIGAGNYSKMTLGPLFARMGVRKKHVCAKTNPAGAGHLARKFGFAFATTDLASVFRDPEVNAVVIATRPDSHVDLACGALDAGKHTLVEKPMAIRLDDLPPLLAAIGRNPQLQYLVGFNRRFSPHIQQIRRLVAGRSEPLALHMSINPGILPAHTWYHDPAINGGRIVGEGCHFIDLLMYLTGSPIVSVNAMQMGRGVAVQNDKMAIQLQFADGSVGTVNYFSNGAKAYPKEQLEVFSEGRVLKLDNFRVTTGFGFPGFRKFKTRRIDKGHSGEFQEFFGRVAQGGPPLIPIRDLVLVTLASFAAMSSAQENRVIRLADEYSSILDRL